MTNYNKQLKDLTNYLIKELQGGNIEFVDLLSYHRAKQNILNKKYYGED